MVCWTDHCSIFFVNRRGDNTMSPDWATDGSYLAFREIEEHVPEFNDFLKTESAKLETYNDGTGEKLAAHMMGRWKNGMTLFPRSRRSTI